MITHHDFFSGALGKVKKLELPRMYSCPLTTPIQESYSIEIDDNDIGINDDESLEVLACSLDGRLWLFRKIDSSDIEKKEDTTSGDTGDTSGDTGDTSGDTGDTSGDTGDTDIPKNDLIVIALKWNDKKGLLKFAETETIEQVTDVTLARGIDWIITSAHVFMVDDNDKIHYASFYDEDIDNLPDTLLYSVLRNKNHVWRDDSGHSIEASRSGIDPFTKQAWGQSEDNGNSEGNAYFCKDTHLLYPAGTHIFEQCYSLLPAVGDWQIFENFLVRRPDNPLTESYNHMLNIRPLLPLELYKKIFTSSVSPHVAREDYDSIDFNEGDSIALSAYGTGYNVEHRGIQLAYLNGQLWGRGLYHIGRVFLFPAGFDITQDKENTGNIGDESSEQITYSSSVQEYYLYISPDFPNLNDNPDKPNNWLDIALASVSKNSLYAFVSDAPNPIRGGACLASIQALVLNLYLEKNKNKILSKKELTVPPEWGALSENNGRLFFDYSDASAMLLDNDGAKIFLKTLLVASGDTINAFSFDDDGNLLFNDEPVNRLGDNSQFFNNFSVDEDKNLLFKGRLVENSGTSSAHLNNFSLDDDGNLLFKEEAVNFDEKPFIETSDVNYECKTIRQWLAPADFAEAITDLGVVAADDFSVFFSNFFRDFHREVFHPCYLALSYPSYVDENAKNVRLSIAPIIRTLPEDKEEEEDEEQRPDEGADNDEEQQQDDDDDDIPALQFSIRHSASNLILSPDKIDWDDVYREPVKFTLLKIHKNKLFSFEKAYFEGTRSAPIYTNTYECFSTYFNAWIQVELIEMGEDGTDGDLTLAESYTYDTGSASYGDPDSGLKDGYIFRERLHYYTGADIDTAWKGGCTYIDPETGKIETFSVSGESPYSFENPEMAADATYDDKFSDFQGISGFFSYREEATGIKYEKTDDGIDVYGVLNIGEASSASNFEWTDKYIHLGTLPKSLLQYNMINRVLRNYFSSQELQAMPYCSIQFESAFPSNDQDDNTLTLVFRFNVTGALFAVQVHDVSFVEGANVVISYSNFPDTDDTFTDYNGISYSKKNFHVIQIASYIDKTEEAEPPYVIAMRSEYDPDIFNFNADLERVINS